MRKNKSTILVAITKRLEGRNMSRKKKIADAAAEVMAELGFHEATIDLIAARAEVSVGTIYNYFRSKEDILAYIFEEIHQNRLRFLEELVDTDATLHEKLLGFFNMHFKDIREHPTWGRLMLQEVRFADREGLQPVHDFYRQVSEKLQQLLVKAVSENAIRSVDIDIASAAIFGAMQGITMSALFTTEGTNNEQLSRAAQELAELINNGLLP